jgi:hypothetical protein
LIEAPRASRIGPHQPDRSKAGNLHDRAATYAVGGGSAIVEGRFSPPISPVDEMIVLQMIEFERQDVDAVVEPAQRGKSKPSWVPSMFPHQVPYRDRWEREDARQPAQRFCRLTEAL